MDKVMWYVSIVLSHVQLFHGLQHARLPCPSPSPGVCPSSCPLNWWCHPTISSFVVAFSSFPQSFPASGSFPMSQLFTLDCQSIASASKEYSVLISFKIDWFDLLAFQMSNSSTIVQNHQLFGEGNGNPLQYSRLENSMGRKAWWAIVHGAAESWTWLSNWAQHSCCCCC